MLNKCKTRRKKLCRLNADLPRTDNKQESWHKHFNDTLSKINPGLYDCLRAILDEQADQETVVRDFQAGKQLTKVPEAKYLRSTAELKRIVAEYETIGPLKFLQQVSNHISIKRDLKIVENDVFIGDDEDN